MGPLPVALSAACCVSACGQLPQCPARQRSGSQRDDLRLGGAAAGACLSDRPTLLSGATPWVTGDYERGMVRCLTVRLRIVIVRECHEATPSRCCAWVLLVLILFQTCVVGS